MRRARAIPIVKKGEQWHFDPSEEHEDLLSRRIRKAELGALNVVVAFVEAQPEYHRESRRGDGVREYAQQLKRTPGQQDGLYWEGQAGKAASPLAGLASAAGPEGRESLTRCATRTPI